MTSRSEDLQLKLVTSVMYKAEGTPMSLDRLRERDVEDDDEAIRKLDAPVEWAYRVIETNALPASWPPVVRNAVNVVAVIAYESLPERRETTAEVLAEFYADEDSRVTDGVLAREQGDEQLDQMSSEFGGGPVLQ